MSYILSNLITLGNLFCGVQAIYFAIQDKLAAAYLLIFLAMVLDLLDGEVARLTRSSSEFGSQIDSFADFVSFGLAPTVLACTVFFHAQQRVPWIAAFLYVTCAMIRLARYNILAKDEKRDYFFGLPSPAAAGLLTSFVWMYLSLKKPFLLNLSIPLMVLIALLMVSSIKYSGFRKKGLVKKTFFFIVFVLFVVTAFSRYACFILFWSFAGYALGGLFAEITQKTKDIIFTARSKM